MRAQRFKLSDKFIDAYKDRVVPWGPTGYIVFKRTYARKLDELYPGTEGTEEWYHTCRRVIEGMFTMQKNHCVDSGLPWNDAKAQRTAKDAFERLFTLKWTPPGRGLWMMGTKFVEEKTGSGLFNCAFCSTKDLATKGGYIYQWMMDALMLGIGVGFDTLGADTLTIKQPSKSLWSEQTLPEQYNTNHFTLENLDQGQGNLCIIADSREGWTESVLILLDAFLKGSPLPRFDYSQIRALGTPIKGFGGTSSGPAPLIEMHESLVNLYTKKIGQVIDSVTIVDTQNLIGRCVVAGNVRRSAALAMGQVGDEPFMIMKDRKQFPEEVDHHRWGSNNSIEAKVGMDYKIYAKSCQDQGEPGFIWLDNAKTFGRFKDGKRNDDTRIMGFNPCVEQQLEDRELCCLVETYPWLHDNYEDWQQTLKIAYLYAKTVTLAKTSWPDTNAIMLKNRRIGLSISGFDQACNRFGTRTMYDWCDIGYQYIQRLDGIYSDWLCIPRSKRTTSVKPSGTVSLLNGSTPGMHWPIAQYAIRRITFSNNDPLLAQLTEAGYVAEVSNYYPNSHVVEFPVETAYFNRHEGEVSLWEQMERAAQLMWCWSDNSVSVTVKFKDHEAHDIENALKLYETRLKAVSFLRYENSGYTQMPYEPITKALYEERIASVLPVNFNTTKAGIGESYCDGDKCVMPQRKSE